MSVLAIEAIGLTKSYRNGFLANDNIDFTLQRGQAMAVLGPNGAGKTTLIRQITGELSPTGGSIHILGINAVQEPLKAKHLLGVVPQEASVFPDLKPAEQIEAFGRLHGLSGKEAATRARVLIDGLGLGDHRNKLNKQLSGGLKRKVLIATAIIARPPILILDEPTTGLDPHSRREVWAMLRDLRRDGISMLITTHYMDEAEALSDAVTVVAGGRVLAQGSIDELRDLCGHRFKATFVWDGEEQSRYGASQPDLIDELSALGVVEFSLARTSLEDLYLELTLEKEPVLS